MEGVSLGIMALGLAALLVIFIISRMSRPALPKKRDENVPLLRDEDGNEISSVLDDMQAKDGKRPSGNARNLNDVMSGKDHNAVLPPQLILFVAADIEAGFAGSEVLRALNNAGLKFGEMDIFHRYVLTAEGEVPLFGVANGVKPWTLVPEDLEHDATPGLSMILNLPSPVDNNEAIHDFVRTAERLTADLGGILKDQDQVALTPEYRNNLLRLAA